MEIDELGDDRHYIDIFVAESKAGIVRPFVLKRLGEMLEAATNEIDKIPKDSAQKTKKPGEF